MLGFASRNGFDGFIMLNLYPKRTPYPDKLPKRLNHQLARENQKFIKDILVKYPKGSILAAWGSIIEVRPYFKHQLDQIKKLSDTFQHNWLQIGSPTKSGHPRHPSRAAYAQGLNDFDIAAYLNE